MTDHVRKEQSIKGSSNRLFGLVFALVFLLVAFGPLLNGRPIRLWALAFATCFGLTALIAPRVLAPFNRLWTKFGRLLHKLVNPLVLAIMFFLVITPVGLIMRALGNDPLRLRSDAAARSYWIERTPPGPAPETFINQF